MNNSNVTLGPGLTGHAEIPQGSGPSPGLVVLMEAYGITAHIRGVCARLARAGFAAVAPDIFHGDVISYTDMDKVLPKIRSLDDDTVMAEIGTTLDWLAARQGVPQARLGIIGFCMGGRLAFLANCRHPDRLKVAVSFYGGGIAPEGADRFGRTPPIGAAAQMQAPLFLGYGADDQGIPPGEHARIAQILSAAKKRFTLALYPGAGHGFLCEERASFAPAVAEHAWQESIAFLQAHTR